MLKVLYSVRAHQPYERYWLKSSNVIKFCLVDRVVIPIAVRSKEWRHLKRSVSSVFAAACQIKLGGVVLMVTHGFCKAELRVRFSSPPNPLPSADAFESSTAMGDNAMFPETTFNP